MSPCADFITKRGRAPHTWEEEVPETGMTSVLTEG